MMQFKPSLIIIAVVAPLFISACSNDKTPVDNNDSITPSNTGTMTDYEGNIYKTVKIGNQWWMAENLKTTHDSNGNLLVGIYAYNDDENNISEFGRLYEYEAAINGAPPGWHLPTDVEWDILENTLGSEPGTKLKDGGSSGFDAKLAGYRSQLGDYESINEWVSYWTSVLFSDDHGYIRNVTSDQSEINHWGSSVNSALSVRYIKD